MVSDDGEYVEVARVPRGAPGASRHDDDATRHVSQTQQQAPQPAEANPGPDFLGAARRAGGDTIARL